jgi:hypothetical protein
MEAEFTSETSTLSTSTECKHTRAELISTINYGKSLTSVSSSSVFYYGVGFQIIKIEIFL